MKKGASTSTGGLSPLYQNYERQKCFIGLSNGARWHDEIESTCDQVLRSPAFSLEPWYADHHFDPTKPLLDIVVEMIANARYGIYDLSYWRKDEKSEWVMPRNVFIELGIAIALNRPTLLLQHEESRRDGPKLSESLESIRDTILPFTGDYTLKKALENRLPQWVTASPEQEWRNRYCHFGNRTCMYREVHPRGRHWVQGSLPCHISHGPDRDQIDFRNVIENVLQDYNDVQTNYLNEIVPADGYDFLLCMYCQKVRSTPFAIYRITPQTTSEAFIAIGISIALEKQFDYKIPKILLAEKMEDVPSLLRGEKIVLAKDNLERKRQLQEFLPLVYRVVRKTTWKSRPLPFIEVVPRRVEKPLINRKSLEEVASDEAIAHNQRGNTLYDEQRYEEALAEYEQVVQLAPNIAHYHYNKGFALHHLNRYLEAKVAYGQAIQIAPEYASAYGRRGSIYVALKEYQQALQDFDRALELDASLEWVKALREEVAHTLNEGYPESRVEVLAERYQLQEPIDRGSMTTIYRGYDMRLERIMAIKVLNEVYSTDQKFVTRFQRGAKASSTLQHPNVVRVYDYGQSGSSYFIVMELIEGTDLHRYLSARGVLAIDRAIIIAHDVALGLGAAHHMSVVHNSVKPQNIMIGRDGSIKLTGFGMADSYQNTNAERLMTIDMTLDNISYYSPEQTQGEIVTPATDVYALGIVMYVMLTGRTPFDGDTPVAVAMQHVQDAPTPPRLFNPAIPPALEKLILRCLEKVPEKRFSDGSSLARALKLLGEEEIAQVVSSSSNMELPPAKSESSVQDTEQPRQHAPEDVTTPFPKNPSNADVTRNSQSSPGNDALQRLVNPLTRLFSSPLEHVDITRKLERELERNTVKTTIKGYGQHGLAPNIYDIYMSIKDHQRMAPGQAILIRGWQNDLVEFARQHRFTLRTMPIIRLHSDSSLRLGQVRIESVMADPQPSGKESGMPALSAEQLVQLRAQLDLQLPAIDNSPLPQHDGGSPSNINAPGTAQPTAASDLNNAIPVAPPMPQAWLTIRLPQAGQQIYRIEKPVVNFGRQLSNDIIVEDKRVSRYHAQIKYQPDGQFAIFDLGSTNGITINNIPQMRQHILRNGDRFTIGSYDFYFEHQ